MRAILLDREPTSSPAPGGDVMADEGAASNDAMLVGLTRLGGVSSSPRLPSRYLHVTGKGKKRCHVRDNCAYLSGISCQALG